VAGRIVDGNDDFGFVVSMADNLATGPQLLVQRKSLNGDQAFIDGVYAGTREYNAASATYTFKDADDQTLATWSWSEVQQQYALTVTTSELTLNDIVLIPQGDLILEGGDGEIQVGRINGFLIDSDYHADWASIQVDGQHRGTARIDIQGLRPSSQPPTEASAYAHHWFAIAVELQDQTPAWVSAWRIEALEGPYWTVTIARGSGATWQIERSLTEGNSKAHLTVEVLEWQVFPQSGPAEKYTGRTWRLTAPDDSLDLTVAVTPGQFIRDNPLSGLGGPEQMQEAIGVDVTGTILNQDINTVHLAAVESTAAFDRYFNFLPALFK